MNLDQRNERRVRYQNRQLELLGRISNASQILTNPLAELQNHVIDSFIETIVESSKDLSEVTANLVNLSEALYDEEGDW